MKNLSFSKLLISAAAGPYPSASELLLSRELQNPQIVLMDIYFEIKLKALEDFIGIKLVTRQQHRSKRCTVLYDSDFYISSKENRRTVIPLDLNGSKRTIQIKCHVGKKHKTECFMASSCTIIGMHTMNACQKFQNLRKQRSTSLKPGT